MYLYNPTTQMLDDTEDKNFGKKVATTDEQQKEADRLIEIEKRKMELDSDYIPKLVDPENIKVAMSESAEEEVDMMLTGEAIEYFKWLKKNPDKTYNDWLNETSLEEFTKNKLRLMAEKDLNSGISSLIPLTKKA